MAAARAGRLLVAAATMLALSGCGLLHRHRASSGCREPQVTTDTDSLPQLKIPEGLDAPDTRNAVRVPTLSVPERPRAATEPCLSQPPSYVTSEAPVQPTSRTAPEQPAAGATPAPEPAPAP